MAIVPIISKEIWFIICSERICCDVFSTVSFKKLLSLCCNNAASYWYRRSVDGAQCKFKCWFVFTLSCKFVEWLTILCFPVNLSGDWLLSNLKHWKASTVQVVGEGNIVSWGGARTKYEARECKLTKNTFLNRDLLKLCRKKNTTSLNSSLTQPFLMISKLAWRGNGVKIHRSINQSNHNIHKFYLRQSLPKYPRTFLNEIEVLMILANRPII